MLTPFSLVHGTSERYNHSIPMLLYIRPNEMGPLIKTLHENGLLWAVSHPQVSSHTYYPYHRNFEISLSLGPMSAR